MKKIGLFICTLLTVVSCSNLIVPDPPGDPDTTPPHIDSVYTNPDTLFDGHPFSLIVSASDPESSVYLYFDMDNDGYFDDSNSGAFYSSGNKTVAVKAVSSGGMVVNYYNLTVNFVSLNLFMSYTANSTVYNGQFRINYTISNYSNVPIRITSGLYTLYNFYYEPMNDVTVTSNTLVLYSYIPVSGGLSAVLAGSSAYNIPYYFDYAFTYDDGYGNSDAVTFLDGEFSVD